MKLFWFFAAVAIAQEVDDLGNKKNKNDVDKVLDIIFMFYWNIWIFTKVI